MPGSLKFRKKPVEIEAVKVADLIACASKNWAGLPDWIVAAYESPNFIDFRTGIVFAADHVVITTLEGEMRGDMDDWIIRGVKGELYPCKPDIFEATYESVAEVTDCPVR